MVNDTLEGLEDTYAVVRVIEYNKELQYCLIYPCKTPSSSPLTYEIKLLFLEYATIDDATSLDDHIAFNKSDIRGEIMGIYVRG